MIEVITADPNSGVTGIFDLVTTSGVDDIYLYPVYGAAEVSLASHAEGDMDPSVPGLGEEDAAAFAIALTQPDLYENTYGISADEAGDLDDDFDIDFDDIDDFVKALNEAGVGMTMDRMIEIVQAAQHKVPEPSTLLLAAVSGMGLLVRRRRK